VDAVNKKVRRQLEVYYKSNNSWFRYHPRKKVNHITIHLSSYLREYLLTNKELPKTAESLTIHPSAANVGVKISE
jgi:hypothetical protein